MGYDGGSLYLVWTDDDGVPPLHRQRCFVGGFVDPGLYEAGLDGRHRTTEVVDRVDEGASLRLELRLAPGRLRLVDTRHALSHALDLGGRRARTRAATSDVHPTGQIGEVVAQRAVGA